MPDRQSRHPDNDLIDSMTEQPTPSHQGSSGGGVSVSVGKRAEENGATDPDNREPVVGSDNPDDDALKGSKTHAAIRGSDSGR